MGSQGRGEWRTKWRFYVKHQTVLCQKSRNWTFKLQLSSRRPHHGPLKIEKTHDGMSDGVGPLFREVTGEEKKEYRFIN